MRNARGWAIVSAALAALTVASACAGGNSDTGAGANATVLTPHPKSVSVTLDGAKAATTMMPVYGGSLTATGADGSVFTLTIPDQALGGPENVTMTPLTAINGLPFSGGLVAGVQLEPDGLQLFRMATLTIKPKKDVPIAKQVAVSYHGSGDNVYMLPLDPTAGISMHILHFSGYSVASGITGEIEEQAKNKPSDPADQAAQQIAAAVNAALVAARQAALTGTSSDKDAADKAEGAVQGILGPWFDKVVQPKVAAAQADYTLADDAMIAGLNWMRMVEMLGVSAKYQAQIDRLTAQVQELRKKYEQALTDRCISKHDLSAVLPLVGLEREFQLIGVKGPADPSPLDTVKKCLRFELDFETVTPFVSNGGGGQTYVLHDRVQKLVLEPDFPSGNLTARQPHEILGVTSINPARAFKNAVSARPFTVSNLSFHMHFVLKRNAKSAAAITGVGITIDPGNVTGDLYDAFVNSKIRSFAVEGAYECVPYETIPADACWGSRHRKERPGASTTVFLIALDYAGTSLFARRTYDLPCTSYPNLDCGGGNEKTTFDLRHVPAT